MSSPCLRRGVCAQRAVLRSNVHVLLAFLLHLGLVLGCDATPPAKPTPPPKAVEIVQQATEDALKFGLNSSQLDKQSLATWRGKIASAASRADLETAWRDVPALAAHADFLQKKVFEVALDDGDWPKDEPENKLEAAWVEGVRNGVAKVLEVH